MSENLLEIWSSKYDPSKSIRIKTGYISPSNRIIEILHKNQVLGSIELTYTQIKSLFSEIGE